jgi:ABC-2 type transport system ATP-binding protein
LKEGDIVGFLGPNGAGKSTLMKIICCYLSKDEGEVNVCGLNTDKDALEIKSKIGYLAENNPLYSEMYIKEYLDFVAGIYSISKKKINEMISLTGLEREQHKKISQLSKGYKQRVGLAAALIHDPEVLILDEPTTGLDPNQLVEVRNLIKECGKNKTVLLSTHIMQEVERICNRVIIINKGQIVANEKLDQLKSNNVDLESYFQKLTQ